MNYSLITIVSNLSEKDFDEAARNSSEIAEAHAQGSAFHMFAYEVN